MIELDPRVGSGELERYFLDFGVSVNKSKLEFGDIAFDGCGPGGTNCRVCMERKRIEDLIDSMKSKRLSGHQLPGMAENYDYGYLLVEGLWRPSKDGAVEVSWGGGWKSTGIHYAAVAAYVAGLELRAGLMNWRTGTPYETVCYAMSQYRMWQKPWDEHRAHEAIYAPVNGGNGHRITLRPRELKPTEEVASRLPGIDRKARDVAKEFRNVEDMVLAKEERWKTVKGVGKIGAKKIWEWFRRE